MFEFPRDVFWDNSHEKENQIAFYEIRDEHQILLQIMTLS